jgi:hypothetical protein
MSLLSLPFLSMPALVLFLAFAFAPLSFAAGAGPHLQAVQVGSLDAGEVTQGVIAGPGAFYLVSDHVIKKTGRDGKLLAEWSCEKGAPLIHMNAGILLGATLYVAHSNYPSLPKWSSIELFDAVTLRHAGSHSFGIEYGSCTWLDQRDGLWYVCFAHYGNKAAEPGRDPSWAQLVVFDDQWRRVAGYVFPADLVAACAPYSFSGGAFGPDGRLYVTGHDNPFLYVLELPEGGSVLKWVETIPVPLHGQAFSWDDAEPWVLHGILREGGKVVTISLEPAAQ